jgi:hypothetical protein
MEELTFRRVDAAQAASWLVRDSVGAEKLRVSGDYTRVTFSSVDPPLTFTWEKLQELMSSQLARNLAEEARP